MRGQACAQCVLLPLLPSVAQADEVRVAGKEGKRVKSGEEAGKEVCRQSECAR